MTSFAIFVLGLIVTAITGAGAILIGLQEASDPSQSRFQDLLFSPRITNLLILATLWAIALPMLIFISDRIHANATDASYLRISTVWRRHDFTR